MKKIIILTNNQIRHHYFKIIFSQVEGIEIMKTYVEGADVPLSDVQFLDESTLSNKVAQHFGARHNTEHDFFSDVIDYCEDRSNSIHIRKGGVNDPEIVEEITKLAPDLIITYGCSIIRHDLINRFNNKIINVHLGLSPYYLGAGTNFHCLVNNEFEFEGYTFMYMDKGVDTGQIIHKSRAKIFPFDNPHQIGNRLIKQMTKEFVDLVLKFDFLEPKIAITSVKSRIYRIADASDERTLKLYRNFEEGAVVEYLLNRNERVEKYPLIEQPLLKNNSHS